jgi:phytoene dehydrogenase-like protein
MHLQMYLWESAFMIRKPADAIIIGSGINSLVCAYALATKGWSVIVLEQATTAGGAIKTQGLTLDGFSHDWAAMNLSLFAGSQFFKENAHDLTQYGVEFTQVKHCFASVFANDRWLGISQDPSLNKSRIAEISHQDSETWEILGDAFPSEAEHLFGILGTPMKIRAFTSIIWRALRKKGLGGTQDLIRFLAQSPRAWLEETFESPEIRATLGAWGMHLDFAPDIAGGALFPYLEAMANQSFGMVLGKGGAGTIVTALSAAIEAKGGQILCGHAVDQILHHNGCAAGVVVDGVSIYAKRAVIANVAPRAMMQLVGGTKKPRYDKSMTDFRHAPGTMMIHLAMSDLPDWVASDELQKFAYVHVAPSLDQMALSYQQASAGLLPQEPVIVVGQPTAVDPSRAPKGKHILWIQVRMVPGLIKADAAGQITTTDWAEAADPFADRVLNLIEAHAPGLRAKILGRRIVTPIELESDNPNLVGGDQVCGSHHLSQNFLFRPARGYADGTTPIRNLYHTGAAVWPGAGTGAGSGYQLGRKLTGT